MPSLIACRLSTSIALPVNISWWTDRGPYRIADRDCEALAKVSYKEAARFKRKPTAWHPPWPPRPEPRVGTEDEADDLLLRAAQAALRRGGVPAIALSSETLGELICEGNRYKKSYPDAQWLVPGCFTCKPEVGATYFWRSNFRFALGEPKSPEEIESHCDRLLRRASMQVQAALLGS